MKKIIIVHGIGGGDTKTKSDFSADLKKNVLSEIETDQHSGYLTFCWHYLGMLFNRGLRQGVPQVFDYLLDLPLYIGDPRGEAITGSGLAAHTAYWQDIKVAQQIRELAMNQLSPCFNKASS